MPKAADIQMQELVEAITTTLQNGDGIESLVVNADLTRDELDETVRVIQTLNSSLIPQEPSAEFSDRLRADLLGRDAKLTRRLRQMPARVHIAAILAICFGCVLFVLRRLFGSEPPHEIQEEAVVTPM